MNDADLVVRLVEQVARGAARELSADDASAGHDRDEAVTMLKALQHNQFDVFDAIVSWAREH